MPFEKRVNRAMTYLLQVSRLASRSLRRHSLSYGAAVVLFLSVAAPAQALDQTDAEASEGWSVFHDPSGYGACYARETFGRGTSLTVGKLTASGNWVAEVSNPTFNPIQTGSFYEIRYVFDKKFVWSEKAIGTERGLRLDVIDEEFVDDFARASTLKLFFQGRNVDSFKLSGTRAAVAAINQCYVTHARKTAPYAASEPDEPQGSP
jgi:hypothetical protein